MTPKIYSEINELLADYSAGAAALEGAEAEIKTVQLAAAERLLPRHAEAQVRLTDLEARLRKLSDDHYDELFPEEKKRSHDTPFGTLKYRKSSKLKLEDEEKVMLKIERVCAEEVSRAKSLQHAPRFTLDQLVRTHVEPNLEALEAFDDATLRQFGITREREDKFTIAPFEMKADKPAKKKLGA